MALAVNYHRWILKRFTPFLGKRIVEVGGGTGSFSELLLETRPEILTVLEPSANMYPVLVRQLSGIEKGHLAQVRQCTLVQAFAGSRAPQPDSILYVNVLEHIEDDKEELRTAHSVLAHRGRVLIFVPANPWLMGSLDRQLGHFRRYTMRELSSKCRAAGFTVRHSSYFDLLGILPWWLKYCILKSDHLEPAAVRFYDRWVVPISSRLEGLAAPPLGKSIVLVGEK